MESCNMVMGASCFLAGTEKLVRVDEMINGNPERELVGGCKRCLRLQRGLSSSRKTT